MSTDFRKNIFDQDILDLTLEISQLVDTSHQVLENTEIEFSELLTHHLALAENLDNYKEVLKTSNGFKPSDFEMIWSELAHSHFQFHSFGHAIFSDFLKTLRHLQESTLETQWLQLFSLFRKTASLGSEANSDLLMTIRHLCIASLDKLAWEDFVKTTSALTSQPEDIFRDFLMTVRRACELKHILWSFFFKATITTIEDTNELQVFLINTRHFIEYCSSEASQESFFKMFITTGNKTAEHVRDAFSLGQLQSKKWLLDEMEKNLSKPYGTIFVLAGWIGSLSHMLFDRFDQDIVKIRSFDLDAKSSQLADKLNQQKVSEQWKFKAVTMDIRDLNYPSKYFVKRHDGSVVELYDEPDILINTSCEHIQDLQKWWSKIPYGTTVVLQNNNAHDIADHWNCVNSIEEFEQQLPLNQIFYKGSLQLQDYTRFMMIGKK